MVLVAVCGRYCSALIRLQMSLFHKCSAVGVVWCSGDELGASDASTHHVLTLPSIF